MEKIRYSLLILILVGIVIEPVNAAKSRDPNKYWWDYLILPSEKTLKHRQQNDIWYQERHKKFAPWKY